MNAEHGGHGSHRTFPQADPFPHAVLPDVLPAGVAREVEGWLETSAAWRLEKSPFYSQFGCRNISSLATKLPADLPARLAELTGSILGAELHASRLRLSAHRLLPGQGIGIHNDEPSHGTETHRLVVTFTRNHRDDHGGHLVLLRRNDPRSVAQIVRPHSGVGVAFALTAKSWHAVSEVIAGIRYSLIFAFWEEGALGEPVDCRRSAKPSPAEAYVVSQQWQRLVAFLDRIGAGTVPHSTGTLLEHLVGTGLLLESWGCPTEVCAAGMIHSIYGTETFPQRLVSVEERPMVVRVIGAAAENLAFLYSRWPSNQLDADTRASEATLNLIARANRLEQEFRTGSRSTSV